MQYVGVTALYRTRKVALRSSVRGKNIFGYWATVVPERTPLTRVVELEVFPENFGSAGR